jgi:UDP-N-acetylglucosamine pyrophosphorylase
MEPTELDRIIERKMVGAGVGRPTITAFLQSVHKVIAGERGLLREDCLEPIARLPRAEELHESQAGEDLRQLVIIKLNGGLGTSMGLNRAKSLIPIKARDTFLDFIARQVLHLRAGTSAPAFCLMDSFSTQKDTLEYLRKYPELAGDGPLDFLQNKVPKLDAQSFAPVTWASEPELEWCPPGHGDIYPTLAGSGLLDRWLNRGIRYAFVSNSDNLGATVDLTLAKYFAQSGLSFLMEVAERTGADRKGGHLARSRKTGRLLLRESAQCPKEDEAQFQDLERHRFFNTNNLWVRLDHLQTALERNGGALPLPLIANIKTVDPKDARSPKVLQLESAMGAAIECFDKAGAVVVPRSRFAPVKTTADLLVLRSDAYRVTEDFRLVLAGARAGQPPVVDLDESYKLLDPFELFFREGAPSLQACRSFRAAGPLHFAAGVICRGAVEFVNRAPQEKRVAPGVYSDTRIAL